MEPARDRARPEAAADHVPPLRLAALTRLYDGVARATLREERWRPRLVAQADLAPGHRVLDLGCGTGTLTLLLQRAAPDARVIGLDADAAALEIAREKIRAARLDIELRHARVEDARIEPGSLDRIVSSLVLHHLLPDGKRLALGRALRWLRPGGELHVADWGRAGDPLMRVAFLGVQLLDGFARTRDHARTGLEPYLREAGFRAVAQTYRVRTPLGVIALYRGERP